jgi:FMN phosphatase YigB (HAD superfamily)
MINLNDEFDWSNIWEPLSEKINRAANLLSIYIYTTENTAKKVISTQFNKKYERNLIAITQTISQKIAATFFISNDKSAVVSRFGQYASVNFQDYPNNIGIARFLAGVLMSAVVSEYLTRLNGPKELRTNPLEQLILGYTWSQIQQPNLDFLTELDILRYLNLSSDITHYVMSPISILGDEYIDTTFNSTSSRLLNQLQDIYQMTSGEDSIKKLHYSLQNKDQLIISATVDRLQQVNSLMDLPRPNEERVVFLDLDLTLFDYTTAREKGAREALKELPLKIPISDAIDTYNRIVENWAGFESLGYLNLRRIWNDEIIYYLTYLFSSEIFKDKTDDLFNTITGLEKQEHEKNLAKTDFELSDLGQDFNEALALILADVQLQQSVRRAYLQFERATEQLEPFKETRDILTTLSKMDGYHVFVVTEGDPSIQWEKIEKLGLQDLIHPSELIVTDDLVNQSILNILLIQTKNKLRIQQSKKSKIERLELEIETIRFFKDLLGLFHQKKDGHFYRHALHIALSNIYGEQNEDHFSNVSEREWKKKSPIKVATVGDRYTNDILPLLKLLGPENVISIHYLYGKYKDEIINNGNPIPDFTINRLVAARNILMQDRYWSKKGSVERPRHFGKEMNENDLFYALIGLTMPNPISSIAQTLFEDQGINGIYIEDLRKHALNELIIMKSSIPLRTRLERILILYT